MLGIYSVVKVEEYGWTSARTLGTGAVAALLLAGFFVRQAKARTPLMPLRILRSRSVAGANLVQMLMVAALFSFQILVALYLQRVLGYGAAETGLAMLPAAAVIGAVSSASRPAWSPASANGTCCSPGSRSSSAYSDSSPGSPCTRTTPPTSSR